VDRLVTYPMARGMPSATRAEIIARKTGVFDGNERRPTAVREYPNAIDCAVLERFSAGGTAKV
jgi:hypothetical protein